MVYTSQFPQVDIPKTDLYSFLTTPNNIAKTKDLDAPVVINCENDASYSWNQVKKESNLLAAGWKENIGITKGDTVAIFAPNQYDHIILYLSLLATDCIITPGNPAYTESEFRHQIVSSGSNYLITVPALLPVLLKIWDKLGYSRENVLLFGKETVEGCRPFNSIKARKMIDIPVRDRSQDVAFVCYSSGTTGLAKGVMLTHQNFIAQTAFFIAASETLAVERTCVLGFLPFFHIYGLNTLVLTAYHMANPVVVMTRFDLDLMCRSIEKYQITTAAIVPPIAVLMTKSPIVSKYNLSSIRSMFCGAAPLGKEHIEALQKRIPSEVKQGFGMTETTSAVMIQTPERNAPGSIGVLVPNTECKIVNEEGKELGPDKEGELLFRGPTIMKGYMNNDKANAESFTSDGWMRTGDVAKYDSSTEQFYIVDRIKELIKYKGFQVAPAELEALLMEMDIVTDCCVIGIYDENQATEIPRAYIVVREGVEKANKTAQFIQNHVAKRVANHKKLRGGVRFINEVPKSNSGKILRKKVKEWAKQEHTPARARL
ncbi:hypothetical protein BY458DRAFT_438919 [Sporodiniella umbellata]|nr:hypothetical protein BY458DRAFT_438919 [Sporodiniella umbellata]